MLETAENMGSPGAIASIDLYGQQDNWGCGIGHQGVNYKYASLAVQALVSGSQHPSLWYPEHDELLL